MKNDLRSYFLYFSLGGAQLLIALPLGCSADESDELSTAGEISLAGLDRALTEELTSLGKDDLVLTYHEASQTMNVSVDISRFSEHVHDATIELRALVTSPDGTTQSYWLEWTGDETDGDPYVEVPMAELGRLEVELDHLLIDGQPAPARFSARRSMRLLIGDDASGIGTAGMDTLIVPSHGEALGCSAGNNFYGNDAVNVIHAGDNRNEVYGYGSNDTLYGHDCGDTMYGGDGDDVIRGNDGDDVLWGEVGNDILEGNSGNNTCYGGPGLDTFVGCDIIVQ